MATEHDSNEKILIIVESPTKAKTIKKFLPANCTVAASGGHVRDLPGKDLGIDVKNGYKPKYIISQGKDKVIKALKGSLKDSTMLLLATDEDREGESISWHLLELLNPKIPYKRMVFHEITKKAILEALHAGRDLDIALVNAQEARRVLDRLYGFTVSPVLWKKLSQQKLSAGRVQSPGLRLIVERERQRLSFVQSEYWDVVASLAKNGKGSEFSAKLESVEGKKVASGKDFDPNTGKLVARKNSILINEEEARKLAERLKTVEWNIADVQEKEKIQRPAPPFITSTLQQEANRKLRLGAKDTMKIAQKLYESGLITYMRTDSPSLSQEGIRAARSAATQLFGPDFLSPASRQYSARSASAQEAHEAIRPAGDVFMHPDDTGLKGKEFSLYDMIWKRTLASQMADAVKAVTTVKIAADDALFVATGNRILFPGFIKVYVEGRDDIDDTAEDDEHLLPSLKAGENVICRSLESVRHETKPPARYTEATLVQELEKLGIGRPSTYAAIIDKLLDKAYVLKENNALVPTFTAFAVVQLLERNFGNLVDYSFTSNMESSLDEIAVDKLDRLQFLTSFYEGEQGLEHHTKAMMSSIKSGEAKKIELPHITRHSVFLGKYGPFVSTPSSGDTEEKGVIVSIPKDKVPSAVTDEELEILLEQKNNGSPDDRVIGIDEKTKQPILLFNGRFGQFYQLGVKSPENPNPKRASVPKGVDALTYPIEKIMQLLAIPRLLGKHPKTNKDVIAGISKYGPFVAHEKVFRSLKTYDELFTISLDEAIQLLDAPVSDQKKKGSAEKKAIADFGEHDGKPLSIQFGRYGYYGKHGKDNFRLPAEYRKDKDAVLKLTREDLIRMLSESS
ncbi:MAG: type I DNA topoisomerase [Sphaerochaetaceae bacterium]